MGVLHFAVREMEDEWEREKAEGVGSLDAFSDITCSSSEILPPER